MWDLALSDNGDLIFSGSKDIAGISGTDLIEQRMRLRLKMHRGEWSLDDGDRLGSRLWQLVGMRPEKAQQVASAYVQEALRDMQDEISISDVQITTDSSSMALRIGYRVLDDPSGAADLNAANTEMTITLGGTI